jgi:hypothetical protein
MRERDILWMRTATARADGEVSELGYLPPKNFRTELKNRPGKEEALGPKGLNF